MDQTWLTIGFALAMIAFPIVVFGLILQRLGKSILGEGKKQAEEGKAFDSQASLISGSIVDAFGVVFTSAGIITAIVAILLELLDK